MQSTAASTKSQPHRVADLIRTRIVSGEFAPGEPLRQIPLSKEFGVAQTVVREALQLLDQNGLVSSAANVGFSVREMGKAELLGAYQVREVLEGLAARLCCRTASRADVEWLEEVAHAIYKAKGKSNRDKRSELEHQFHHRFLKLSGNETLIRQSSGYRFVGDLVVTDRDPDKLLEEHLAIVQAVAANEPEKAERFAREHVAASAQSIREQVI